MTRRLFPDNDAWSTEVSQAGNEIGVALMDVLEYLEQDGPIDLKDFHYLVTNSVSCFVSELSIRRRLGSPDEPPRPIIKEYPRFNRKQIEYRNVKLLPGLEVAQ